MTMNKLRKLITSKGAAVATWTLLWIVATDLGVNLAGVDMIFRMRHRMIEMEEELEQTRRELQRLRDRRLPAPRE